MPVRGNAIWWYVGSGAAVMVAAFAAVHWPVAVPIVVGAAVFAVVAAAKPNFLAPALALAAIPLMRPNVLGERYSAYALGLAALAALAALIGDRAKLKVSRPFLIVFGMVVLMYLWMAESQTLGGQSVDPTLWQGMGITAGTLLCVGVVVADPRRMLALGRMFVWGMIILCASYTVTFLAWRVSGVGALRVGMLDIDKAGQFQATLYLPFTPSFGTQGVAGTVFPRFTGIGREPGWMGLYCGVALLILGRVGKPSFWKRAVLIAGVLGTFSTAAFGALAVGLGVAWLFRRSKSKDAAVRYFGFLVKLGFLAAALWVAIYAPVLGFAAKGDYNAISLHDRQVVTDNGIAALFSDPLGGSSGGTNSSINLIAAIAPFGVPFVLIVLGALVLPRIGHRAKRLTTAPIFVIGVTLLLSQPAADSTFVFILAGLVYGLAGLTDAEPLGAIGDVYRRSPLGERDRSGAIHGL